MITVKTGVPGSGKTCSMVVELLANSKLAKPRPVYTNIEGLAIPHILMRNWEAGVARVDGVLYTIDWRQCPVESIIVIDEAFLYGYDGKSSQAAVPDYIRDLAVHRKDYSVDIWFIAQHPKLLHQAVRRQVGRHQHYRRLFGMGRAVVYEWDMCEDNLGSTKTAVKANFAYPRSVYKAYKSAQVHTKPQFKLPWWVWLPVAIIPAAVWAFPAAFSTLSSAMTGKGIPHTGVLSGAPAAAVPFGVVPKSAASVPAFPALPKHEPVSAVSVPTFPANQAAKTELAGCIVANHRCGCFDTVGKPVEVAFGVCEEKTAQSAGPPAHFPDSEPEFKAASSQDLEMHKFLLEQKRSRLSTDKQIAELTQLRF